MRDDPKPAEEERDLISDPLLAALSRLPREDLDASRTERTRMRAHRELSQAVQRHQQRPAAQLECLYTNVLEPALVAIVGAFTLARAAMVLVALFR